MILGLDPGPTATGLALWDGEHVVEAASALPIDLLLGVIDAIDPRNLPLLVAIERVQSYGISGADLLRTSEVVGRLWQRALDRGHAVRLVYRREVLAVLDVAGKGNRDSLVRQRLLERFGGTTAVAVGTKRAPGPLRGVSGHAWQALAVALAAEQLMAAERDEARSVEVNVGPVLE